MKFETTKIDGIMIRYAASRSEGKPQLLQTSPQPMSVLTYRNWWDQLAQSFDVVAVDLPNHGGSDPARHVTTVSQHEVFLGNILDHFGLSHPHEVGSDIGTPTLMRFMAENPRRVKSATVGDAGRLGRLKAHFPFGPFCIHAWRSGRHSRPVAPLAGASTAPPRTASGIASANPRGRQKRTTLRCPHGLPNCAGKSGFWAATHMKHRSLSVMSRG